MEDKQKPSETPDVHEELARLKAELEIANLATQEHRDLYMRSMAEAENVRKRNHREIEHAKEFILEDFFQNLLPILDSFDKALENAPQTQDEGVGLVYKQLWSLVEKHGLTIIRAADATFDPTYHMAIQKIECDDVSTPLVAQEFSKGYSFRHKLLRPAMVSVKIPRTASEPENS